MGGHPSPGEPFPGFRTRNVLRTHAAGTDPGEKYQEALRRFEEVHGVMGNSKLMSDPIHPNDAGYTAVADRFHEALKSTIPTGAM